MLFSRRARLAAVAAAAVLPLLVTVPTGAGASTSRSGSSGFVRASDFGAEHFSHPTRIDNRYLPLVPGKQFVLKGTTAEGPHVVIFTVTDLTKVIHGVRTRVVWDRDYSDGQLQEAELAFFAQSDDGTVWAMGEYPEEFEDGKLVGAPSTWIAGLAGAKAGIMMQGHPRLGTPSYSQGFAASIEFADRARVFAKGLTTCVPVACYHGVLETDEWDALDPEAGHQRKFYAPHVGNVRISAVGGDQETLVLTSLTKLGDAAMDSVRVAAVTMDQRGHRISKVYSRTAPVRR